MAAVLGVACILVFGGSFVFGYKALVVISGSMEPTIPVDALMFSQPVHASVPQPGDVVTVERPRNLGLVTHRLVSTQEISPDAYRYVLRGDANTSDDPAPYDVATAGKYLFHIPYIGALSTTFRTTPGILLALAIALGFIAVFLLDPSKFRRHRLSTTRETSDQPDSDERSPDTSVTQPGSTDSRPPTARGLDELFDSDGSHGSFH
ncbi:signal peptidase I [Paenarthrobacter sp. RAF9]